MKYSQLTPEQRYQISGLLKAKYSQNAVAKEVGVNASTISRELTRNKGKRGYRPKQAQEKSDQRRRLAKKHIKFTGKVCEIVESKLREDWSPDQIRGFMKRMIGVRISNERIYQHIVKDKKAGGTLHTHLRCKRKKYKKRYGSVDKRGQIKNRISIEKRPEIVEEKERIGDWEGDTIIGKRHKQAVVSLVDRKAKYTLLGKVERKEAALVRDVAIRLLEPYPDRRHTGTVDNGKEFAFHQEISEALGMPIYFAHPYSSWERGLNENTNGLVRQYLPKGSSFEDVDNEVLQAIMDKLNHRPRKSLGYRTPAEIFCGADPPPI